MTKIASRGGSCLKAPTVHTRRLGAEECVFSRKGQVRPSLFGVLREVPHWLDYEQNTAQTEQKGREPIRKVNPRLCIEASWYIADHVRICVDRPHAFDCQKSLFRNRIRNVEHLAARNSEITDRLFVSPIRNRIRNLQFAEPLDCQTPTRALSRDAGHTLYHVPSSIRNPLFSIKATMEDTVIAAYNSFF